MPNNISTRDQLIISKINDPAIKQLAIEKAMQKQEERKIKELKAEKEWHMLNPTPSELAKTAKEREVKRLETEKKYRELKPSPESLVEKQRIIDEGKLGEYTTKLNQQQNIATGIKDGTEKYNAEIQKLAQGQIPALEDSVKLWYEWKKLRDQGYDVSLPQLREYKKAEEQKNYAPLAKSISQMKARGFNKMTIDMFSNYYIGLIKKGHSPQAALTEAYRTTKITNPTDFWKANK